MFKEHAKEISKVTHLRVGEMNNGTVIAEHVNFLDSGNWVDRQFLQLRLKFFVVGVGCLVYDLLLSSGSTFTSNSNICL